MKAVLTTFIFLLLTGFLQAPSAASSHPVRLKGLLRQYERYNQIQLSLVNEGERSIFLDPYRPGLAPVHKFEESTGEWYLWGSSECGVFDNPSIHEVKPGGEQKVFIEWGLFITDLGNPPDGRYRLTLRYALEPWAIDQMPEQVYVIESQEFKIAH